MLMPRDETDRKAAAEADARMMAILHDKGEGLNWPAIRGPLATAIEIATYFIAFYWLR